MDELPGGIVTFLFTDIEGSTRLLAELGADAYGSVLEEHRSRLRAAFECGREVDAPGDALFFAFARADEAVDAAAAGQRALDGLPLRVRMGVHTGQPTLVAGAYVGLDVHRAARICAAANGGQILLSQSTRDLCDVDAQDLGEHRLKDLTETHRLYQLVAPGLEREFPPLRTLESSPTNLPVQPTPLVGRTDELAAVTELLARDDVRLVTLTGPGGAGKTRLALHAAATLVEEFPNGVWLVALEAVDDPGLVVPTIAQTLGVHETGAQPLAVALRDHLADRRLLLVLDNFEQVLGAAARVGELLGSLPRLELLVTSRAPLRLAAEHVVPVPPLGLPDPGAPADLAALSRYESVVLFVERARAAAPAFAMTDENAAAVAELCVRLDGLPLAIELAAARVKLLPPRALLARLGARLALLSGGPRDRPERHRTLRSTLDWSRELLGERERVLFAHLAVFAGGFRLEAAEAICEAGLDEIEALLENNLLRSQEQPDGEARFSMLETIRDYAVEQLVHRDEAGALRTRHAEWFAAWIEQRAAARARGLLVGEWEDEDAEHDNIRAALASARDAGEIDLELRLAAAAGRFYWPSRGFLTEGRRRLDDALARADGADEHLRAVALLAAANLAWRQGDPARSDELAAEAQPIFERVGDPLALGGALVARAIAADWRGERASAAAFYDRAEWILREHGDTGLLDTILVNRAYVELVNGDFETAEGRLREVADARRGPSRLFALVNHGVALTRLGRLDEAEARFVEALREATASPEIEFYAIEGLATVAGTRGDGRRAARLWGASETIREETGYALAVAEQRLHDEVEADVRARIGADAFERERDEGRRLPRGQARALALQGT